MSVAKIAGLLPVSTEMQADAAVNITTWVQGALADSLSRDLDLGILGGGGPPAPTGVLGQADPVDGASLTEATGKAIAAIGEAGGTTSTIAMSPTIYAAELTRQDDLGHLVHPDGLPDFLGLAIVQVPALASPLVYDAARCFLVLGQDSNVTLHDDPHHDSMLLLVKARANAGIPVKAKAIRAGDYRGRGAGCGQENRVSVPGVVRRPGRGDRRAWQAGRVRCACGPGSRSPGRAAPRSRTSRAARVRARQRAGRLAPRRSPATPAAPRLMPTRPPAACTDPRLPEHPALPGPPAPDLGGPQDATRLAGHPPPHPGPRPGMPGVRPGPLDRVSPHRPPGRGRRPPRRAVLGLPPRHQQGPGQPQPSGSPASHHRGLGGWRSGLGWSTAPPRGQRPVQPR